MIKTKKGTIKLKGNGSEVLSDLTVIVLALLEEGVSKEDIHKAVDIGFTVYDGIYKKM